MRNPQEVLLRDLREVGESSDYRGVVMARGKVRTLGCAA